MADQGTTPTGSTDPTGPVGPTDTPAPRRRRWGGREYSPEEVEEAKQVWRDMRPWESPMARADKVLIGAILAVLALGLVFLPLRPLLLAGHPITLSAITGSSSAVGAGAAFARIGQADLWLVVVAGVFGKVKFDWLWWWAGRRWGARGVRFFVPSERAQRFVSRVRSWPAWTLPVLLVLSSVPGVPAVPVFLLAGIGGTRLLTFLVADVVGAGLLVGLLAGLGYALGQQAVDAVLAIDQYALWISLAIALIVAVQAGRAQNRRQQRGRAATDTPPSV